MHSLSPLYLNDVFKPACQNTTYSRTSLFKLNQPLRKADYGQKYLSYDTPSIWNKFPDFLKQQRTSKYTNTELKKHFFRKKSNDENNICSYFYLILKY